MNFLSQIDIDVRLELTAEHIADYANTVSKQFMYGQNYASKNFKILALLVGYTKALTCYQPITGSVTEADNCMTEEQAQNMFDHISLLTGISFASLGASYVS